MITFDIAVIDLTVIMLFYLILLSSIFFSLCFLILVAAIISAELAKCTASLFHWQLWKASILEANKLINTANIRRNFRVATFNN